MSAFGQKQTFVGFRIFDRLWVWHTKWQHWAESRRSILRSPPMLWPMFLRDLGIRQDPLQGHTIASRRFHTAPVAARAISPVTASKVPVTNDLATA